MATHTKDTLSASGETNQYTPQLSSWDKSGKKSKISAILISVFVCLSILAVPVLISNLIKPAESEEPAFAYITESPAHEVSDSLIVSPEIEYQPLAVKEELSPSPLYIDVGISAPEVAVAQQRLMQFNYMEHDEPAEYFSLQTKISLKLFQREQDLSVNGILDDESYSALMSENIKPYALSLGVNGADVREMQLWLKDLGYYNGSLTGYFGLDTEAAVESFQSGNNLDVDGKFGVASREVLYSGDAARFQPAPSPTPSPKSSPSPKASSASKATSTPKASSTPKLSPTSTSTQAPTPSPTPTPASATNAPDQDKASSLISFAKTLLNKPYVTGGKGPDNFDCSGFVYYCLNSTGTKISYMTSSGWAKANYPTVHEIGKLMPGDIACFNGHVGIVIENGMMIDASSSTGKVRIVSSPLGSSAYWKENFICGKRVF